MKKFRFLMFSFFLVSLFFGAMNSATAQVNAGADGSYLLGASYQLNATGATYYSWSPTTYLSNPYIANPIVSGASAGTSTTYTVTGQAESGSNLITNGDFEAGNVGFSSAYTYVSASVGALQDEGKYGIGTSASAYHTDFSSCSGDNMMIINGAPNANEVVWAQGVTVTSNTDYAFSVYLASVHPSNPATLQFSIDGTNLGSSFTASGTTCDWNQFYVIWNSGSNTNITISVVNRNTIGAGNDFAIDDVKFIKMLTTTDDVTVTCGKMPQTIVFNTLADKTWGDANFTISATGGDSGNPVTFVSDDETIAKCTGTNGTTVEILKPGTCNITASQLGNATYYDATPVSRSLTILRAPQVITFNALADKTWENLDYTVSATGGASGNPVTFTSSNTAIAQTTGTNGSTIHIVKPGTCNIIANQAGNTYYLDATPVSRTQIIHKAPQVITFNPLVDKTYGDADYTISATGGLSLNPITFTSSDQTKAKCINTNGATIDVMNAGSCDISANQAGNDYYLAAPTVTRQLVINKAPQVIVFEDIPSLFLNDEMGNKYDLVVSGGGSGNPVTLGIDNTKIATLLGSEATILNLGRAHVTANQAGNDNYYAATAVTQILDVLLKTHNFVTPNSDGKNDTWIIPQADALSEYNVYIFNNIGAKLYESKGYGTPWDCTFNDELVPFGTYYFIIENGEHVFKGYITVKY